MKVYLDKLEKLLLYGKVKTDRTGTGTLSLSGESIEVFIKDSFPLLTTKKVHFKSVVWELLWFLSGSTNIKLLQDNGVTIWDEWADKNGELGRVYGSQWRWWGKQTDYNCYEFIDQISNCINLLKSDPYSRRNVVSAWNVAMLDDMALPPCHYSFQMVVESNDVKGENDYLSCIVSMRSGDALLGLPYNIASYSLLTYIMACECNLIPNKVLINVGDMHLYKNHIEQAKLQLTREPLSLPRIDLTGFDLMKVLSLKEDDMAGWREQYECIKLLDYTAHPAIKAPIAV